MKLAFIFTEFPSGQISNSTRIFTLLGKGHDITVFANSYAGNQNVVNKLLNQYPNLNIIYIKPNSNKALVKDLVKDFISYPRKTLSIFYKIFNIKLFFQYKATRIIGGRGSNKEFFKLVKRRELITSYLRFKKFENKHFDAVLCFFGPTGINYLFVKHYFPKSLFCTYFVGFDYSSRLAQFGTSTLYDTLFKVSDVIFAKSTFSQNTLVEIGCPERKVLIDYNGIDLNKYKFSLKKVGPSETVKFIIVSRLIAKKSHLLILKAFLKLIHDGKKNFTFTIVGSGPLEQEIKYFIDQNIILKNKVNLVGYKNQDEVSVLLKEHHIFVHPSTTSIPFGDKEDIPTSILEAMASGLPVISTFHAGIPDAVLDGFNGKLVPERNIDYLAEAILFFLLNPDKISLFGREAHQVIKSKFNTVNNCDNLEEILQQRITCAGLGTLSHQD